MAQSFARLGRITNVPSAATTRLKFPAPTTVVGDDVAGAGQSGANEGVGLAGMAGIGDDRAGEGSGRVVAAMRMA
jgi:hypothetical protein